MRVLVIGGTNFIGPYIIGELHRKGHQLTVYHRGEHEAHLPPDIQHIHSPRAGIPVLHFPSALSNPPPEVVLHMFPVGEDDTRAAAARFAGVARRLVLISSGDVYKTYGRLMGIEDGEAESGPLDEGAPLRQTLYPYRSQAAGPMDWKYHYEKILAERAGAQSRLSCTVLRLPAVYGPGDPHHRLRPYIKRMLDHRPGILLEADLANWRWSHGYVEDVAQAVATVVVDERGAGQLYNLGEAGVPTTAERIRRIGEMIGWKGEIVSIERSRLPAHLVPPFRPREDLVMSTSRIRLELGYRERLSVEEGLGRTIEWERGNTEVQDDPGEAEYRSEDAALRSAQGVT